MSPISLLNASDPDPVRQHRGKTGESPFLLVGDHAGSAIPAALGDLGLEETDRHRHIAVDIGVESLGRALCEHLDALFLSQAYSRLVVDCNRWDHDPGWIATESDRTPVPGNCDLGASQREARRQGIYLPYHEAIAREIDRREAAGQETILVSLHSFTPMLGQCRRSWEIGVLHDGHRDDFALSLLRLLKCTNRIIGDNEPYRMDSTDYTVPAHAFRRDLRYVELEFRQDILASEIAEIASQIAHHIYSAA